jgi:hypothetical protein
MVEKRQDFMVDRLTDSICNVKSGDSFQTTVALVSKVELSAASQSGTWKFDWKTEFRDISREVYKLTINGNEDIIQGLISISIKPDFVYMNLVENATFNIGRGKVYEGVAGNLVAFACRLSFQRGYNGFVGFLAKSKLIEHYSTTLGADHIGGGRMIIDNVAANELVSKYYKLK